MLDWKYNNLCLSIFLSFCNFPSFSLTAVIACVVGIWRKRREKDRGIKAPEFISALCINHSSSICDKVDFQTWQNLENLSFFLLTRDGWIFRGRPRSRSLEKEPLNFVDFSAVPNKLWSLFIELLLNQSYRTSPTVITWTGAWRYNITK